VVSLSEYTTLTFCLTSGVQSKATTTRLSFGSSRCDRDHAFRQHGLQHRDLPHFVDIQRRHIGDFFALFSLIIKQVKQCVAEVFKDGLARLPRCNNAVCQARSMGASITRHLLQNHCDYHKNNLLRLYRKDTKLRRVCGHISINEIISRAKWYNKLSD